MNKTPLMLASVSLLTVAPGCLGMLAAAALANAIPCDGRFVDEIQQDEGLSEECRAELAPYLPDPTSSFDGRLVTLGQEHEPSGAVSLYLHGIDGAGRVFGPEHWDAAAVTVWQAGVPTELSPADFTVEPLGDSSEPFMSLAVVNDYSSSMLDSDLDDVESLELMVVEHLPPATEGSVTNFSEEVERVRDFTDDHELLAEGLRRDDDFPRAMTALYDGMGSALDDLIERDRPVRVLMVSSDGLENASDEWEEDELMDLVEQEGVVVVVLGALFADMDQMRDLTEHDGVFFYTPFYADMDEQVEQYVESLQQMTRLTVPSAFAGAERIEIEVGGERAVVELPTA